MKSKSNNLYEFQKAIEQILAINSEIDFYASLWNSIWDVPPMNFLDLTPRQLLRFWIQKQIQIQEGESYEERFQKAIEHLCNIFNPQTKEQIREQLDEEFFSLLQHYQTKKEEK